MNSHKLGYKLLVRKQKKKLAVKVNRMFEHTNPYANTIIALMSLYWGYKSVRLTEQGNTLSKAAYNLSVNDTSQQAQINKLAAIISEIKLQNDISKDQTAELIRLTNEANTANTLSNRLLGRVENQVTATTEQLRLSKKNDSLSSFESQVRYQNNIFSLVHSVEDLYDFELMKNLFNLCQLPPSQRVATISSVKQILERELNNPIIQTDVRVNGNWVKYYTYIKIVEQDFKIVAIGGRGRLRTPEELQAVCKTTVETHIATLNKLLKYVRDMEFAFYNKVDSLNIITRPTIK